MNYRKVWIKRYGPIPDGYVIHHIDGNRKNNRIENLRCMERADHIALHKYEREEWVRNLPRLAMEAAARMQKQYPHKLVKWSIDKKGYSVWAVPVLSPDDGRPWFSRHDTDSTHSPREEWS